MIIYNEQVQAALAARLRPLWIAFLGTFVMLLLQHYDYFPKAIYNSIHSYIYAPIRNAAHTPLELFESITARSKIFEELQTQVINLERSNRELNAQLQLLAHYRAENRRLKLLMDSIPDDNSAVMIAEIRSSEIDGYNESVTINKGKVHGVFINQAVIDPFGLVGQVTEVFDKEAKVMLISDARSRVPVYVERTQQRALVSGGGEYGNLQLSDLRLDSDIQVGDHLISSGLGNVFPRGYPVAEVTAVERDQRASFLKIHLKSLAKLNSMLEVLLLGKLTQIEKILVGAPVNVPAQTDTAEDSNAEKP